MGPEFQYSEAMVKYFNRTVNLVYPFYILVCILDCVSTNFLSLQNSLAIITGPNLREDEYRDAIIFVDVAGGASPASRGGFYDAAGWGPKGWSMVVGGWEFAGGDLCGVGAGGGGGGGDVPLV